MGLAYDETGERLFVVDIYNSRVMVFDVASITNGENAVNVLGQTNFTTWTSGTTQSKLDFPTDVSFDNANQILFVSDANNFRVLTFDVASITNGENAVNVIGQEDFVSNVEDLGDANFYWPQANYYNEANEILFVSDFGASRVMAFNGSAAGDLTSPVIAEVTPVPTPDNDATPEYTFSSDEAGDITYGGACSSIITAALVGNNTVTFDALAEGTYNDCTVMVTDAALNDSNILNVSAFTIDTTTPAVDSIVRASANPTTASSVDFTVTFTESVTGVDASDFSLNTTGTASGVISSVGGGPMVYTVTVSTVTGDGDLRLDLIDNDSILDSAGNPLGGAGAGNGSFIAGQVYGVDNSAPTVAEVTPVSTPSTDTTPSYTFNSTEGGNISYGGGCTSATTIAASGNNTITFNALAPGVYNCTITVTDPATNLSNVLNVNSFTISNPPAAGGGGGAGGGFGKPAVSGGEPQLPTEPEEPTTPVEPSQPQPEPTEVPSPINSENPTQPTLPESPTVPVQPQTPTQTEQTQQSQSQNVISPLTGVEEEIIFVTEETSDELEDEVKISGSGIYGREANRTSRQLSLTCNYSEFAAQFGLTINQSSDADGDGLSDQLECLAQTNPTEADTDGDGFSDADEELTLGTNPREADGDGAGDLLVITTPEEQMLTGDETPLVKGINTSQGEVEIYIFDSKDFENISAKIITEIEADENLNEAEKAEIYDQKFTQAVQNILSKYLGNNLDSENPEEAKFIDRIQLLGTTPTAGNNVFLLDSEKSLVDNTYLAMAHNEQENYSEEVEFKVDSSLKVLNPDVETLGSKPIPAEALLGDLKIEIDPGNLRPVLAGNIKEPSKVVANWQSDIVSSALIADSLDEDFRLAAPADLEPGEHTVYVTAYRRSDGAQSETLKIPFTVSADGTIVFTEEAGIPWWYVAAGLGAVILIGGGVWMIKRKKS